MERVLEILDQKQIPSVKLIQQLCHQVSNVLLAEPNVLRIDPGVKVIGSLYGQYYDLLQLLNQILPNNYLFLGNCIGYGQYSLETILLLFALKVKNPNKISLLRGNQQTNEQSINNGLFQEIFLKYGNDQPWKQILTVFKYFPLAAVIGDAYLAISGCVDQSTNLNQIRQISRSIDDIDKSGLFWNTLGKQLPYGKKVDQQQIKSFLLRNKLKTLIKSNELFSEGYQKIDNQIICICSCPHFKKKYNNKGAYLIINDDLSHEIITFKRVREPESQFKSIDT